MYLSFFDRKPLLEELDFRSPIVENYLQSIHSPSRLAEETDLQSVFNLQNIIISGPESSGKSTHIYGFLASLFNNRNIYLLKNNVYESSFHYKSSSFHIEFSTKYIKNTDITNNNKNIDFIRTITTTNNIAFSIPKIIYIRHFETCSQETQKFFLRIIERSIPNVRFILEVSETSKLIEPIRSRFLFLRIQTPPLEKIRSLLASPPYSLSEEVVEYAIQYSSLFNFTYRPADSSPHYQMKHIFGLVATHFSAPSNRYIPTHIKKAILLRNFIFQVRKENFFSTMHQIRDLLLEFFVNNVSLNLIVKFVQQSFIEYLVEKEREDLIFPFSQFTQEIDHMLNISNKQVIFAERFILHVVKTIFSLN